MKKYKKVILTEMAKEQSRGVFWYIDDDDKEGLLSCPFAEGDVFGLARSGLTYNHKNLWKELRIDRSKPYNYYPRGRVDIDNRGMSVIYLNPRINEESIISQIRKDFGIKGEPVIQEDRSQHYKCYRDEGWKGDFS